jgi:hypothetical protein
LSSGTGLKKWNPATRSGFRAARGDLRDRERRRVGRKDRIFGNKPSSSPNTARFTSRFSTIASTPSRNRHLGERADDLQPAIRRRGIRLGHLALFRRAADHTVDEFLRLVRGPFLGVEHFDPEAAGDGNLRDTAPHGAGANDAYGEIPVN